LIKQLADAEALSVLEFTEFILSKRKKKVDTTPIVPPILLARPNEESVVAAIKRLNKSYPMLDKAKLLDKTSNLMTQHIMQGRNASEVIDEMEVLFKKQYQIFNGVSLIQGKQ